MSDICLSIDWDFFVPGAIKVWEQEDIDENFKFFLTNWIKPRWRRLEKQIKPVNADKFWQWLSQWFVLSRNRQVTVSESHAVISKLLSERHETLILFDSHHDCYSLFSQDEDKGNIDCGNWGTYWLRKKDKNGKVIWISQLSPGERKEYISRITQSAFSHVKAYSPKTVESVFDAMCKKAGGRVKLDFIHICRSGCWSPPWTDIDFLEFLKRSKFDCKIYRPVNKKFYCNPMTDRWDGSPVTYWTKCD